MCIFRAKKDELTEEVKATEEGQLAETIDEWVLSFIDKWGLIWECIMSYDHSVHRQMRVDVRVYEVMSYDHRVYRQMRVDQRVYEVMSYDHRVYR